MASPLLIDYYSDILCVWAWIAQRRIDELEERWGEDVALKHRFINLFGDTTSKIERQWRERDGFEGFAEHVRTAAADYEEAPVHADLWLGVRPRTSASAHLVLRAVALQNGDRAMVSLARVLRESFFVSARDIGNLDVCLEVAAAAGHTRVDLEALIRSGDALAALTEDYRLAESSGIQGSPSWVMNQGRQVLYGNVGYRILHANVEELLRRPDQAASWC